MLWEKNLCQQEGIAYHTSNSAVSTWIIFVINRNITVLNCIRPEANPETRSCMQVILGGNDFIKLSVGQWQVRHGKKKPLFLSRLLIMSNWGSISLRSSGRQYRSHIRVGLPEMKSPGFFGSNFLLSLAFSSSSLSWARAEIKPLSR